MICPAEHKHAVNSTCYIQHKCRCTECRAMQTARARQRNKLKAYGRFDTGLVDAQPVRDHVAMLQASGMGWKRIAEVSGVGKTAVSQLIYGRKGSNKDPRKGEVLKRFGRDKAEKLFAVQPEISLLRDGALIDSTGFRRRVQALVALGWSLSKIASRLGMEVSNMTSALKRDVVRKSTHDAASALFDELWNVQPPRAGHRDKIAYSRSKRLARERGWVPPLAWDDIDRDVEPAAVEVEPGRTSGRIDEVEFLLSMGMPTSAVCEAVGVEHKSLERYLQRENRHDLALRLSHGRAA